MLKELIKVIQQEHHSYKDPVTEFLECLYVNYDFDGAQQKLIECEQVTLRLLFLQFSRPQFLSAFRDRGVPWADE
jgi:translation initiation factor 3 subunit E